MKTGRYSGFTLIELMGVVVVIAILVAVAYPSYQDQVLKAKRTEGRTALLKAAQQLERFYTDRNTYGTAGVIQLAPLFGLAVGDTVYSSENPANPNSAGVTGQGTAAYQIVAQPQDLVNCPVNGCFEIRAVQNAPQFADVVCGDLTLTSTGVRCWTNNGGTSTLTCAPNPANAARCRW